jgi:hypothetical protein
VIARTWRGWTAAADADRYVDHLQETGIAGYQLDRERHADHFDVLASPGSMA